MMSVIYKVLDQKGRITIPFEVRNRLNMKQNDILSCKTDGNHVIITKEKLCNNCCCEAVDEDEERSLAVFLDGLSDLQKEKLFKELLERYMSGKNLEKTNMSF
jgi:AbrB family looped-hinge helix DNA binding protein